MRDSLLLVLAVALLSGGCSGPTPPPFRPVVDNKLLMQAVVDPNADLLWDAVKTIVSTEGTESIALMRIRGTSRSRRDPRRGCSPL